MRYTAKNLPKLALASLLRRRKMTLKQFLTEFGISTYEGLCIRCNRIGVLPPSEQDFDALGLGVVNAPAEGVIILEPPAVIDELTGKQIDPEAPAMPDVVVLIDEAEKLRHEAEQLEAIAANTQKNQSKKKESQQG